MERRTKKRVSFWLILILLLSMIIQPAIPETHASAVTGKYLNQGNTIEDIVTKWNAWKTPTSTNSPYLTAPSFVAPYNQQGVLTQQTLQNGINMTNFSRYLAGVPSNVTLDATLNDQAQAGAYLLSVNNSGLNHRPDNEKGMAEASYEKGKAATSSSNLSTGSNNDTVAGLSVISYMKEGESNLATMGHRRWILNPKLGKVGFGAATSQTNVTYSAMKVFDTSNTTAQKDFVSWPSAGYFPVEMFDNLQSNRGQAWTISLDQNIYGANYSDSVEVSMTNKKTGVVTRFYNGMSAGTNGKHFAIEKANYGTPYCIIFRPEQSVINVGDEYQVTISGLKNPSGVAKPNISYDTAFFSAENPNKTRAQYQVTAEVDKPVITTSSYVTYKVTVKDPDGRVIPNAEIRFDAEQVGYFYRVYTNDSGIATLSLNVSDTKIQGFKVLASTNDNYIFDNYLGNITVTKGTAVTGVSVSPTTSAINVGSSTQLSATVLPSNATNKNVTWQSSNAAIASVDSNGRVTAIKPGTATITVTTADGNKTATALITVNPIAVTGVSLLPTSSTINEGSSVQLAATVSPSNASNKNITWRSSDTTVATVDATGRVTGIKSGTAVITVTTNDGSKTATATITVQNPSVIPTSVTISRTGYSFEVGDSYQVQASVKPDNATNKSVTWASSNPNVASVDSSGVVRVLSPGTYQIYATTNSGGVRSNTLSGQAYPRLQRFDISQTNVVLERGQSVTVNVTPYPEGAQAMGSLNNSNPSAASAQMVTNNQVVIHGLSVGTTAVKAYALDYSERGTINVTVVDNKVNPTKISLKAIGKNRCELVGDSYQLEATIEPSNATERNISWTSSNPSVASVDQNGRVTLLSAGSYTIYATSTANRSVSTSFQSTAYLPTERYDLSRNNLVLRVGDVVELQANPYPAGAANLGSIGNIDLSIAEVLFTGANKFKIFALGAGTVEMKIYTCEGLVKETIHVTVLPANNLYISPFDGASNSFPGLDNQIKQ
ncbi:Ig-like domain-containing protein [Listeria sp. ILCC797]|uniref:Ig-like domain-containing protein n=1 Tax=Listeria sp. ILCC797 TaxID=1918333 RepID=UPI000B58AFC3|nr:Ig-like domain-containing protein [Listeria sp. ILCC797]